MLAVTELTVGVVCVVRLQGLGTGLCVPLRETTSRRSIRTGFNSIYLNIVSEAVRVSIECTPDNTVDQRH